ncbi:MAG: phosphoglycerate dehydrogenase [Pseudomonadota bacterium]
MNKIRMHNQIALAGLERLPRDRFEVGTEIGEPDALLIRSYPLSAEELLPSIRAVARAGAGVNNVPIDACTERGIVVFNTPGANANSVKELVLAGLLMAARDLFGGMRYVASLDASDDLHAQVEAQKKRFRGTELHGKTLGVLGLGAIGSKVARAGLDMGMDVIGYDPAISVEAAWALPSEVEKVENMQSLFGRADYVTLHVPLLDSTRGLINAETLKSFKPGSVLLNFAREPIVDAQALRAALDEDRLRMYVADFPVAGLIDHPGVRLLPHLGASTNEAEENCAIMAADLLRAFLEDGNILHSVNFPRVRLRRSEGYRLAITNRNVPGTLGDITSLFATHKLNVIDMLNQSRDSVAYNLIDIDAPPAPELLSALSGIDSVISVRVFEAD